MPWFPTYDLENIAFGFETRRYDQSGYCRARLKRCSKLRASKFLPAQPTTEFLVASGKV